MNLINKIRRKLWKTFFKNARLSYSQSGEDMILDAIFCNINKGTYVDIGSNNPYVQSNTHYFYKKGWRGVNIDALPGSMKQFKKARPKDKNFEAAISDDETDLTYYMFNVSFFNTFSANDAEKNKAVTKFIGIKKIKTIRLSQLLDSLNLKDIEFMSVDVEGLDLNVLNSNNWNSCRPKVIITECFSRRIDEMEKEEVYQFLKNKGYSFYCKSVTNAFYLENEFLKERFGDI